MNQDDYNAGFLDAMQLVDRCWERAVNDGDIARHRLEDTCVLLHRRYADLKEGRR